MSYAYAFRMWNQFTRRVLAQKLKESRLKNPSFSLRAYAKKVEMGAGTLSEFLSGKRRLSKEAAQKVLARFDLTPAEKKKFESLLSGSGTRTELNEEIFSIVSSWVYFAILSILELENPPRSVQQIAFRLTLPEEKVSAAVGKLIQLNLLHEGENGLELTGEHFTSSDGIHSDAVQRSHMSDCDLAKERIVAVDVKERDFVSLTFAGSSAQMSKAKEEIRKFRDQLYSTMSSAPADNVYKISIQLYPLTQNASEQ